MMLRGTGEFGDFLLEIQELDSFNCARFPNSVCEARSTHTAGHFFTRADRKILNISSLGASAENHNAAS